MAAAVAGETAYIIGGCERPSDMNGAARTVWARPPGATAWEERAPMPGAGRFWAAAAALGGSLLVAGGATTDPGRLENLDDIIAYDAAADRWSRVGRLPIACRGASGLAVDGEFLVLGGYGEQFGGSILRFDPRTGQIESAGSLPRNLAFSSFVRLDRRIYGVGGENDMTIRVPWTPIEAAL
jgi:N-acetylneuraminic acid mutarotase